MANKTENQVGGIPAAVWNADLSRWPHVHRVYADLAHPERLGTPERPLVGSERVLCENLALQPCDLSSFTNSPKAKPFWRQAWYFPDGALFHGHMTSQGDLIAANRRIERASPFREAFAVVRWDSLGFMCDERYFTANYHEILRFLNNVGTVNLMEFAPPFYISGMNWNDPVNHRGSDLQWDWRTGSLVTMRTAFSGLTMEAVQYRPHLFEDLLPLLKPLDLHDFGVALDMALQSDVHRESVKDLPYLLRALEDGVLHPSAWYLRSTAAAVAAFLAGYPIAEWVDQLVPQAVATDTGRLPTGRVTLKSLPDTYFVEMSYNEGGKKLIWQRTYRYHAPSPELTYNQPFYHGAVSAWPRIRAPLVYQDDNAWRYGPQLLTDVVAPQWSCPVRERYP